MYHKALAVWRLSGDYEGQEAIFAASQAGSSGQTGAGDARGSEILGQLGRGTNQAASRLLPTVLVPTSDPELDDLVAALQGGRQVAFTQIPDAKGRYRRSFFTFAAVLRTKSAGDYYVLLYSAHRGALTCALDHIDDLLLTADLLENIGQYELAFRTARRAPPTPRLPCG